MIVNEWSEAVPADFESLSIGDRVEQSFLFDAEYVARFANLSSDFAPVHHDPSFAISLGLQLPIVHGLGVASRFSRLLGMFLPGPNSVIQSLQIKYIRPIEIGNLAKLSVEVKSKSTSVRAITLSLATEVDGDLKISGSAICVMLSRRS